jgi:PadR family transcriptional regulator, regulatory protein PadR
MDAKARNPDLSRDALRVLDAFLDNPSGQLAGADVQRRTDLAAGTLYPLLLRLKGTGWFISRWESRQMSAGRPCRLYRLTPTGLAHACALLSRLAAWCPA